MLQGVFALILSCPVHLAGLLLEIASIIHGQGLSVVEGVIRGGSESPITPDMVSDPTQLPDPPAGRRTMRCELCPVLPLLLS